MSAVVDVVNFNADASCLTSARWLAALEGGRSSEMARWFHGFVEHGRKVSLGLTGATIADLAAFNPDALDIVSAHPEVFEILLRPFSHDIALLRTKAGFMMNVTLGRRAIERTFGRVTPYFLPPEFMLTNQQLHALAQATDGVFINASRFKPSVAARIPSQPYRVSGVLGSSTGCIPLDGALTNAYLESLHCADATPWNIALAGDGTRYSWRDGESWLFLEDGLARELGWLANESPDVHRRFVSETAEVADTGRHSYPVHSFSEWVRESRMLGYIAELRDLEQRVETFSLEELALWLQAIDSDVLSAVEKDEPRFLVRARDGVMREVVLRRSDRGFEAEDFLAMLGEGTAAHWQRELPHVRKLRARHALLVALR